MDCNWLHISGEFASASLCNTCIWRLTLSLPRKYHFAWYKEDGKAGAWKCWKIVIRTSSYRPVSYKFLTCSDVLIANSSFDGYKKSTFLPCLWSQSHCDWGNGCAKCLGGGWAFVTQYPVARKERSGDLVRSWECFELNFCHPAKLIEV